MSMKPLNPIVDEFMPLAKKMLDEGRTQTEIKRMFRTNLSLKKRTFYKKPVMKSLVQTINSLNLMEMFENNKHSADSNAERIFYDLLKEYGIRFTFQRDIGKYRVDYLIDGFLVVELDGPHHLKTQIHDSVKDKYLKAMGYKVYRVPLMSLIHDPSKIILNIQRGIEKYRGKKKA